MRLAFIFIFLFSYLQMTSAKCFLPPYEMDGIHGSRNADERTTHYPLISGDTFRFICDFIFDETTVPFETERVQRGNTIFVGMRHIHFFLSEVLPFIESPFILVTSNGTGTIDETYLPFVENEKLIAWFGRNITLRHPKIHLIPLGVRWFGEDSDRKLLEEYLRDLDLSKYFAKKPIHTYLNYEVTPTKPNRINIFNTLSQKSFCTCKERCPFEMYLSDLSNSSFVLSPRGANIDCFRTWEALIVGSIPVVESHGIDPVYEDLPVIIVEDISKVTKKFLDKQLKQMKQKTFRLEKLHGQYWLDLIQECKDAFSQ